MFLSNSAFNWMLGGMILLLAAVWALYELLRLRQLFSERFAEEGTEGDLEHRDKVFASILGLVLAAIGVVGFVNVHLEWF